MSEQQEPYNAGQKTAPVSDHEHLFRVVTGNKNIVRFCERCGW